MRCKRRGHRAYLILQTAVQCSFLAAQLGVRTACITAGQCFAACSLHNTTAATQVTGSAAAAISVLGVHAVLHLFVNKIPLVVHVKLRINGRLLS